MNIVRIHNYLSDKCSGEERRAVEHWVDKSQENQEFLNMLKQIWDVEPKDEFDPAVAEGYQHVWKRLHRSTKQDTDAMRATTNRGFKLKKEDFAHNKPTYSKGYLGAAVAIVLLLAAILFIARSQISHSGREPMSSQQIQTERGERTSFTLAEGSRVYLNADSKLEVSPTFNIGPREVYLQGEAYFDVTSDPDRPFIIYSKHTYIHVLGTKFGVSAYPDISSVQTVVEEGRVLFGTQSDSGETGIEVELRKNELATTAGDGTINQKKLSQSIAQYLGWKEGKLVFTKTPLEQIIPKLERWYDITLDLQDPALGKRLLTATFRDEPLTEILNVISLSLDLNYKRITGKKIIFSDVTSAS